LLSHLQVNLVELQVSGLWRLQIGFGAFHGFRSYFVKMDFSASKGFFSKKHGLIAINHKLIYGTDNSG